MPSVCIVSSPLLAEYEALATLESLKERYVELPPLGVLVVASLFRNAGWTVRVVDSNRSYFEHIKAGRAPADFAARLAAECVEEAHDLIGFSTVCSSYPTTLSVAARVKDLRPECTVVLGGPQATACAGATLEAVPAVDCILCGEVERSLPQFLADWSTSPQSVPGLAWREQGKVVVNEPGPLPAMEEVPAPAFDLWAKGPIDKVPIEAGRGCPFSCRFCSTSVYFGRRYRVKTPEALVREADEACKALGATRVMMVHDHFGADRKAFHAFCEQWRSTPAVRDIAWSCSLRVDAIDESVIEDLKTSNCENVFIGVESGAQRMQAVLGKRLNLDRAREALAQLDAAGVPSTASFIAGFPEEMREDLDATFSFFEEVLRRPTSHPQILLLSPLASSSYCEEFKTRLEFDNLVSGIARQGGSMGKAECDAVMAHPELFSAHYSLPLEHLDRQFVFDAAAFLKHSTAHYRWLLVAASQAMGGLPKVVDLWWARTRKPHGPEYYPSPAFRGEFMEFIRALPEASGFPEEYGPRLSGLLAAHNLDYKRLVELSEAKEEATRKARAHGVEINLTTELRAACIVRRIGYSFRALLEALRRGRPLSEVPPADRGVLAMLGEEGELKLSEMPPLATVVLHFFQEPKALSMAMEALVPSLSPLFPPGAPPEQSLLFAIEELLRRGLLIVR